MRVSVSDVTRLVEGTLSRGRGDQPVESRVSIDSRSIEPGQVFFAIVGEKQDGHAYAAEALARGAAGIVASTDVSFPAESEAFLVRVADTTRALQDLASAIRERAGVRVVAVTGSMGKTTTKDAAAAAISAVHSVLKSEGNLNNHYGLPLSLLRLRDESVAVVEMGMSAPGEIARLCEIARPDVGVLTNVAEAHLEFFGSLDAIAEAKGELLLGLVEGGVAVVNADDPLVLRQAAKCAARKLRFGLDAKAVEVRASHVRTAGDGVRFTAEQEGERADVHSPLLGRHNVYNLLAGLAAASALDVPFDAAARALGRVEPARHRGERVELSGGVVLIDETYNSNPRALDASIDMLVEQGAKRRVAVVGDMLELGEASDRLHRAAGRYAAERGVDILVTVGALAPTVAAGAREGGLAERDIVVVGGAVEAGERLAHLLVSGDVVLLKGSRAIGLDQTIEVLRASRPEKEEAP